LPPFDAQKGAHCLNRSRSDTRYGAPLVGLCLSGTMVVRPPSHTSTEEILQKMERSWIHLYGSDLDRVLGTQIAVTLPGRRLRDVETSLSIQKPSRPRDVGDGERGGRSRLAVNSARLSYLQFLLPPPKGLTLAARLPDVVVARARPVGAASVNVVRAGRVSVALVLDRAVDYVV